MTYATRHIETQDDVGCYLERQFLKVNLYFKHVQHQMCFEVKCYFFPLVLAYVPSTYLVILVHHSHSYLDSHDDRF